MKRKCAEVPWKNGENNDFIKSCQIVFLVLFSFCKSPSYLLIFVRLAPICQKITRRLGVLKVKCCVIYQGDKFHVISCHNGISESASLFICAEIISDWLTSEYVLRCFMEKEQ